MCVVPLLLLSGVGAFFRLFAVVVQFSSNIGLNTVNKRKLSQFRRSESEVIIFQKSVLSFLIFRFCHIFLCFPFNMFVWKRNY